MLLYVQCLRKMEAEIDRLLGRGQGVGYAWLYLCRSTLTAELE